LAQESDTLELPILGILNATIELATPLLLAALGEIFVERSGILNLGIEGMMLVGAFAGFFGAFSTGNVAVGILTGVLAGALMGILMSLLSVKLGADQVVSGLAIWVFSIGLSTFLSREILGSAPGTVTIKGLSEAPIPLLSEVPIVGQILFRHNVMTYITLILTPILGIILFKTSFGLKIRAVGENPKAAAAMGIDVFLTRYICVIFGGVMAGIAGSYLTLARYHIWMEEVTAGIGWLALVVVIFGKRNPYRALVGAWLFGLIYALQYHFQISVPLIPYQFMLMLPYLAVIVLLLGLVGKEEAPAALGIPYERG